MSDLLGQQVVILNRPGAHNRDRRSLRGRRPRPTAYTLLIAGASSHIVTPALTKGHLRRHQGLRAGGDGRQCAERAGGAPSLPVKTVPELVALAKSKPGVLNYGSVGNGSQPHLAAEMFKQLLASTSRTCRTKRCSSVTDLLAGQIDLAFLNAPPLLPHIQSGKLRPLPSLTMKRAQQLPDVPTLNELGLSGFGREHLYGMTAPAATPKPVMDKLTAAVSRVLNSPDVNAKTHVAGAEVFLLAPKDFSSYLQEDAARLIKLIKNANIQRGNERRPRSIDARMGQTVAQKIIARAAGCRGGRSRSYVNVSPDYTCCQELSWQTRKRMMQEIGVDRWRGPTRSSWWSITIDLGRDGLALLPTATAK
jgi:hypothetical protein